LRKEIHRELKERIVSREFDVVTRLLSTMVCVIRSPAPFVDERLKAQPVNIALLLPPFRKEAF
jgi:hypothetical protein